MKGDHETKQTTMGLEEENRKGRLTKKKRHRGALGTLTRSLAEDLKNAFPTCCFCVLLHKNALASFGRIFV